MSWGDPYDKFYKGDDVSLRLKDVAKQGFVPGALVFIGSQDSTTKSVVYLWTEPKWQGDTFEVTSGFGTIVNVNCDDVDDWLFLLISTPEKKAYGWVPIGTVSLVDT